MANENRQVVRLTYTGKDAFQADSAGREKLSAFILEDDGKTSIGIRSGDTCRYVNDYTEDIATLKSLVSLQAAQMATLAGQIGATVGSTQFGATRAYWDAPLTFKRKSTSGGVYNEFTYTEFLPPQEGDNFNSNSRILIGSSHCLRNFWIRAFDAGSGNVTYRLYAEEADAIGNVNVLATCVSEPSDGPWPFVAGNGTGDEVWGFIIGTSSFFGSSAPQLLNSPQMGYHIPESQLCIPGTRLRIPFSFVLDVGSSGASEIRLKAGIRCQGEDEGIVHTLVEQGFPIAGYGNGRTHFTGEAVSEYLIQYGSYHRFRSWIELRGPDPSTSPLILSSDEPSVGGTFQIRGLYTVTFGYSCANGGGGDLDTMELLSTSVYIDPPPTNLADNETSEEEEEG